MTHGRRTMRLAKGLLSATLAGWLVTGCAQTTAPSPNIIQRVQGETPAPPPPSGFLGSDYSLLTPPAEGSDQKAMLRYLNPNATWSSYNTIMIAPVTFWASDDSKVSAADQQALCDYMFNKLTSVLSKNFALTSIPGPGVLKLSAALTDATTATPGLRSVSVVIPQARVLSLIKMVATGTYAFVGSAQGAGKVNDSVSGQLLAAWVDERVGSTSIKNVNVNTWGDADNAINYWAEGLDKKLVDFGVQKLPAPATAAN
jgi:hypothetical protein